MFRKQWFSEHADEGFVLDGGLRPAVGSEAEQRFLSMIPWRRFGRPDEIVAAIAFLISEDAGFMTGQTLFVDGASIGKAAAQACRCPSAARSTRHPAKLRVARRLRTNTERHRRRRRARRP
jgi:hypothetical protein